MPDSPAAPVFTEAELALADAIILVMEVMAGACARLAARRASGDATALPRMVMNLRRLI